MDRIITIETSTDLCSTALIEDGEVVCSRESGMDRSHASLTAVFIDEMLKERGCSAKDCSAVCVSEGPGSYTGLRVGVSSAKGLCFGADLPLLSVSTLEVLAVQAIMDGEQADFIVPMIDARRMEVFAAVYSGTGELLENHTDSGLPHSDRASAIIVETDSFRDLLEKGSVLFVGDGALKCREVITHPNARFKESSPRAASMASLAVRELKAKRFKDVAYLEPFYLKDFVVTASKKKLF